MISHEVPKQYYLVIDEYTWRIELNVVKLLKTDEILMNLSARTVNRETGEMEEQSIEAPMRECRIKDEDYLVNIILDSYRDELLKISGCPNDDKRRRFYSLKPAESIN